MKTVNEELTKFLKSAGASLIGFADLSEVDNAFCDGLLSGISVAIAECYLKNKIVIHTAC